MSALTSQLDTRSAAFRDNAAQMQALVDDLKAKVLQIKQGGGDKAREKHLSRGKMLPRDRVRTLLDPGSPFLEDRKSTRLTHVTNAQLVCRLVLEKKTNKNN